MKRGRTITLEESLSSISSNGSESDSDDSSDDTDQEYEKGKRRVRQENSKTDKKKKHRKHKRHSSRQQDQQEQPRQLKRQGTLKLQGPQNPTINIVKAEHIPQRKRSNSIDSPQRVNIRSKNKQLTLLNPHSNYNNSLKVNDVGNEQTFSKQSEIVNQQSRRLVKSKTLNEIDQPKLFQFNGGSQLNSKVEILQDNEEDDYNIYNAKSNKLGSQQNIQNKLKPSQIEENLNSNESSNSLYQQNRKRSSAQLLPSQIYDGGMQLQTLENGETDHLKIENQQLQNKIVQQKNKQNELQKINNNLMKENGQQNRLINSINNKLDLNQGSIVNLRDENNYKPISDFDKKINHLNRLSRNQDEKRKNGCVQKIIKYLQKRNPFNGHLKQIGNTLGNETQPYFSFLIYLILLHFILGIVYIYFYIDYFTHAKYDSKYQNFISYLFSHNYSNNTQVSYATTQFVYFNYIISLIKVSSSIYDQKLDDFY